MSSSRPPSEQSSKRDRIAVVVLILIAAVWVSGVWFTSDARHSHLTTASSPLQPEEELSQAPESLHQAWSHALSGPSTTTPIVSGPAAIATTTRGIEALNPVDGKIAWSYSRERDLCGLTQDWSRVIAVFRGPEGCGEATAFDSSTGQYRYDRQAINSTNVAMIRSNSAVGTVSPERVELWRDDLVRTIEYGYVQAPVDPETQPHPGCTIRSALTRQSLLAVVENCPKEAATKGNAMTRLMGTVPKDSRKPELKQSYNMGDPDAQIVAIGVNIAAIYVNGPQPRIDVVNETGAVIGSHKVEPSEQISAASAVAGQQAYDPIVADGPHHMFWWDGTRLYAFDPADLSISYTVEGALGTGVVVDNDQLLVPVRDGIAVVDAATGKTQRTIPVDRGDATEPVTLALAGQTIVEKRGNELVGLRANL